MFVENIKQPKLKAYIQINLQELFDRKIKLIKICNSLFLRRWFLKVDSQKKIIKEKLDNLYQWRQWILRKEGKNKFNFLMILFSF